jgi:hypothetical protein
MRAGGRVAAWPSLWRMHSLGPARLSLPACIGPPRHTWCKHGAEKEERPSHVAGSSVACPPGSGSYTALCAAKRSRQGVHSPSTLGSATQAGQLCAHPVMGAAAEALQRTPVGKATAVPGQKGSSATGHPQGAASATAHWRAWSGGRTRLWPPSPRHLFTDHNLRARRRLAARSVGRRQAHLPRAAPAPASSQTREPSCSIARLGWAKLSYRRSCRTGHGRGHLPLQPTTLSRMPRDPAKRRASKQRYNQSAKGRAAHHSQRHSAPCRRTRMGPPRRVAGLGGARALPRPANPTGWRGVHIPVR